MSGLTLSLHCQHIFIKLPTLVIKGYYFVCANFHCDFTLTVQEHG